MLQLFTKPAVPHLDQAWHDLNMGYLKVKTPHTKSQSQKIKPDPEVVKTIQCNLKSGSQGDSGEAPSWNSPLSSSAENFYRIKWQTLKATSLVMRRLSSLTFFPCLWELPELQDGWHILLCALSLASGSYSPYCTYSPYRTRVIHRYGHCLGFTLHPLKIRILVLFFSVDFQLTRCLAFSNYWLNEHCYLSRKALHTKLLHLPLLLT